MSSRKIIVQVLVVAALFVVASSNVWAIQCQADIDCNTQVGLSDLVIMKQEFLTSGCDPCSSGGVYPAPIPKSGQTTEYLAGDDGDLQKGIGWPNPRFTDNFDGTVTDNLTGLIWLKNADCFGTRKWSEALSDANGLASGSCGLTDGSIAGDWRLPNRLEMESLLDFDYDNPPLSNAAGTGHWTSGDPFDNLSIAIPMYWTSTTFRLYTGQAWIVYMNHGHVDYGTKEHPTGGYLVWPVRGPE